MVPRKESQVECEILQDQLKKVGEVLSLEEIESWPIPKRVRIEQWATRKRWSTLKRPPCPAGHDLTVPPKPEF